MIKIPRQLRDELQILLNNLRQEKINLMDKTQPLYDKLQELSKQITLCEKNIDILREAQEKLTQADL